MKVSKFKDLYYIFTFFSFAVIFSYIVYQVKLFYTGISNLDFGQNIRWLNCHLNESLVDITNLGNIETGTELYILGMNQIDKAFYWYGYACFSLGVILMGIILILYLYREKNKNGNRKK